MKKIYALLFALALIFALSGCRGSESAPSALETAPSTTTATVPETQPATSVETVPETELETVPETAPETEPIENVNFADLSLEDCVKTGYEQVGSYTDDVGNEWAYSYYLPEVLLDCSGAREINQDIQSKAQSKAEENLEDAQQGLSLVIYRMDYTASLKEGVLSLMVQQEYTSGDYIEYTAYNLDLSTSKLAKLEDILALYGLTKEDYLILAAEEAEADYLAKYGDGSNFSDQPEMYNLYTTQLERTKTENDFQSVFIAPDGKLNVIVNSYSLAGADFYPVCLEIA